MKTMIYLDPDATHVKIVELKRAQAEFAASHPQATPGYFSYMGEGWSVTTNGFQLVISRSIRTLPLFFKGLPIHSIELEDSVEDPDGDPQLTPGIYVDGGTRAEVDSWVRDIYGKGREYVGSRTVWTIKVEGKSLKKINELYAAIRQSTAAPVEVWGLVATSI